MAEGGKGTVALLYCTALLFLAVSCHSHLCFLPPAQKQKRANYLYQTEASETHNFVVFGGI